MTKLSALICSLCFAALHAAAWAEETPVDVCSPRSIATHTPQQLLAALRTPIDEAIATLDNANISFPSPSLASGKVNYLTITPNVADELKNICIIGYFEHREDRSSIPLVVDHIEMVKVPDPGDPARSINATRIYFATPHHKDFKGNPQPGTWFNFWDRHQGVSLKLAAFPYQDGVRGRPWFGRDLSIQISSRTSSEVAALLFALVCYLFAALAISPPPETTPPRRRFGLGFLRRFTPWYVSGSGGRASLSQLQMLLFTLVVSTLLFYQWLRTGVLENISTDLLYLIGISTVGAGGSQITDSIKKSLDPKVYDYVQKLGWFSAPIASVHGTSNVADFLLTNNRFDIYKFQMMVFTLVIAAYIIASGADELGSLQISTTLLTLMGMSQGAYMGGKASTDTLGPLQDQLRGMQSLQEQYQACSDPVQRAGLQESFATAARQAAQIFGDIYSREVPAEMQVMPAAT